MTLTTYGHSCVLLEDGGYRLLFDPGAYPFAGGDFKPSDLPLPDSVLVTHGHGDHYDPAALREILGDRAIEVITNTEHAEQAAADGFDAIGVAPSEQLERGPFTIDAVEAAHGELPGRTPPHVAFVLNDSVLHPGDSLAVDANQCETLLLPVEAPWCTRVEVVEFALRLQPRLVIPIHDGMLKDFFLARLDEQLGGRLAEAGVAYRRLVPGASLELD